MLLFPAEGILEVIFSYGQMFSLFLVLVVFEGVIAAKSEKAWPGLAFIGLVIALAIGVGIGFGEFAFFVIMMIPAFLCLIAFYFSRRTRAKNIEKGLQYNKDGLIEDELQKMQKGQ